MKKFVLMILSMTVLVSCMLLPSVMNPTKQSEITKALEDKTIYRQGDILIFAYDIECGDGVGGLTFEVKYDGDNLNLYDVEASGGYTTVFKDDSVGTAAISAMCSERANQKVRIAVSFQCLYMSESKYTIFDNDFKCVTNGMAKETDDYTPTWDMYIYDTEDMTYENYVEQILSAGDFDTDTTTETNKDKDSESDTETNKDKDSEKDTETNKDKDSENDTETNKDKDSENDTETNKDKDSENDTETNKDKDSENDPETNKDKDSENDTDTNSDSPKVIYQYGDIDGDNKITSYDSLLALRRSVKLEEFAPLEEFLADVDGSGVITSKDSLDILRYSVGLNVSSNAGQKTEFPVE